MSDPNNNDPALAEIPSTSRIWLKDAAGHPSVTITFLFVSFWVTTIAYVLSIVSKIGSLEIRSFDVGACTAYFGIVFGAYCVRRGTEAKWGNPNVPATVPPAPPFVAMAPSAEMAPPIDPNAAPVAPPPSSVKSDVVR